MKNIPLWAKKKNKKYYLTFEERKKIEKMLEECMSWRSIAKVLWKSKSCICDEVKNNSSPHEGYKHEYAHKLFLHRQENKGNISKIENCEKLRNYIIEKLQEDWSPEEISGRLKLMHNDPERDDYISYVCHESIYAYIYHPDSKKEKLYLLLRRHKPRRIKHGTRKKKTVDTLIKGRTPLSQREKIIEKKTRIWDFESDSVIFSKQACVLNTNICRASRLARFELVKDKTAQSAIQVQKNIVYEMEELWIPVYSYTFDNGGENVKHQELHEFWVKTYFCDPYCSWQKGAIENLNMFIRQYLPRNTDLSQLTHHDIYLIQEKLNNRPRKCLGYLSPNEFFYKKTWVKPN